MDKSNKTDDRDALKETVPHGGLTRGGARGIIWPGKAARNDPRCEGPANTKNEVDAWVQHGLASNGFGDAAFTDLPLAEPPTSLELYHAARADRSFLLGEIILAVIGATVAAARQAYARWQRRRHTRRFLVTLQKLDDPTPRDLALDRSELASVAAELAGEADHTRVRALQDASVRIKSASEFACKNTQPCQRPL